MVVVGATVVVVVGATVVVVVLGATVVVVVGATVVGLDATVVVVVVGAGHRCPQHPEVFLADALPGATVSRTAMASTEMIASALIFTSWKIG